MLELRRAVTNELHRLVDLSRFNVHTELVETQERADWGSDGAVQVVQCESLKIWDIGAFVDNLRNLCADGIQMQLRE